MADRYTQDWEHLGGIGDGYRPKIIHICQLACLAHCFFSPEATLNDMGRAIEPIEWKFFIQFILAFSHPLAKRTPHQVWPSRYVWQFHLHYFAPVERKWTLNPSNTGGLVVQRQYAKIRRISNDDHSQQYFEERALSVSLQEYPEEMEFKIIVLGDSGAKIKSSSKFEIDPRDSDRIAGFTQFLVIAAQVMECWLQGWNDTLDVIDNIIGFQVSFASSSISKHAANLVP